MDAGAFAVCGCQSAVRFVRRRASRMPPASTSAAPMPESKVEREMSPAFARTDQVGGEGAAITQTAGRARRARQWGVNRD